MGAAEFCRLWTTPEPVVGLGSWADILSCGVWYTPEADVGAGDENQDADRQAPAEIGGVNVRVVGDWVELTVYRGGVAAMRYNVLKEDAAAIGRALRVTLAE